jgi:hypothetical protein
LTGCAGGVAPQRFERRENDAFGRRREVNIRQVPIIHLD